MLMPIVTFFKHTVETIFEWTTNILVVLFFCACGWCMITHAHEGKQKGGVEMYEAQSERKSTLTAL